MAYKKKPPPEPQMITRSACARCFIVEPDEDFVCLVADCPKVTVQIEKSRAEWEAREPGRERPV